SQSEPLHPIVSYSDQRGADQITSWSAEKSVQEQLLETGNEQGPTSLLAKLAWFQQHQPEVLQNTEKIFIGSADYIGYRLTGVSQTDTTTAATTGLMKLSSRTWHTALFTELGLDSILPSLPRLVSGGALLGSLTNEVSEQLKLVTGLPIHLGPGDAGSTTLGAGCGKSGKAYAYCGTSGWVGLTEKRPARLDSGAWTLAHPAADLFIQVAPILTAGDNLAWAKDLFGFNSYEEMIQIALDQPAGKLLYLPYLQGERSPFIDPHARGVWIGMNRQSNRAELTRAVLEGTCFAFRHALHAVSEVRVEELILTGGTSRSDSFCQLFANVLGIPIKVLAEPDLTGLRGALAACQLESATSEPRIRKTYLPSADQMSIYDGLFQIFLRSYPALRKSFAQLAQL
ncbi:MAG: FGGY-family carbohydrate kinase, partial [SAR324 cluster bacterium]|nr:FGGY-family carbohydrate kinase [SAR324 cluster bacterium]